MNITAAQVNELRQMTGAGMMDCKKALVECNGDQQAAIDYLRKKGQKIAMKRADREATEGCVISKATEDHKFAAVIMLNCETDFVGANAEFVGTTKQLLDFAIENRIKDIEALNAATINGQTIEAIVTDLTAKTGEKVQVGKYFAIEGEFVTNYNHQGNRLATIVGFNKAFNGIEEIAHEVALQIAAMDPVAIDENDVPQATKDNEYNVAIEKTKQEQIQKAVEAALRKAGINPAHVDSDDHINSNMAKGWITEEDAAKAREIKEQVAAEKAGNLNTTMLENIAKGRLAKFFKENCLLDQVSLIADPKTVREYIQAGDKEATVTAFNRVKLG
ncbi:MAG: elongation factor Ts [Bacteroidales bacterium]|nr:elongation factor Ts [Bacteroidales bacterium]MBO5848243.1 elongation factor Ts [Bacteroidales bacterium]MBO5853888.1 elongation factor Ts [Bacteroidales bacterium]